MLSPMRQVSALITPRLALPPLWFRLNSAEPRLTMIARKASRMSNFIGTHSGAVAMVSGAGR